MNKRVIYASRDLETKMKLLKQKKLVVYSFFPIDRGNCDCQQMIRDWKDKLSILPPKQRDAEKEKVSHLECPRDKTGMNRYELSCKGCGEVVGYCWATDETLNDFCDFHYVSTSDGRQWKGCYTPNISPIDETIGIECCCGVDSRDMRANMTLPGKIAYEMEEENKRGREFGKANSKFKVRKVSVDSLK